MNHIECIFDFCGNSSSPGIWADIYENEMGSKFISFGGDWISYTEKFKLIRKELGDNYIEEVLSDKKTGPVWLGLELEKAWCKLNYPEYFFVEGNEQIISDLENDCYGSAIKLIEENLKS
jgi:hypothetical protein